jgi:hypothetical protein
MLNRRCIRRSRRRSTRNVNQALAGAMTPEDALKQAQGDMEKALKPF